jgi:hypothetical protein
VVRAHTTVVDARELSALKVAGGRALVEVLQTTAGGAADGRRKHAGAGAH